MSDAQAEVQGVGFDVSDAYSVLAFVKESGLLLERQDDEPFMEGAQQAIASIEAMSDDQIIELAVDLEEKAERMLDMLERWQNHYPQLFELVAQSIERLDDFHDALWHESQEAYDELDHGMDHYLVNRDDMTRPADQAFVLINKVQGYTNLSNELEKLKTDVRSLGDEAHYVEGKQDQFTQYVMAFTALLDIYDKNKATVENADMIGAVEEGMTSSFLAMSKVRGATQILEKMHLVGRGGLLALMDTANENMHYTATGKNAPTPPKNRMH